ncbi:MAG TPA: preprotein translocase subunit SecG [Candidatus Merdivicinus intestinigallinarum]|nr:preprotein translocase subunit SecG [Candidatus Merdivicinus intestinigallinarum]
MNAFEIVSAILLLIACIVLVVLVMLQESKDKMSQTLTGGTNESYLGRNSGRTLDAMLAKITKVAAIVFFVLTILVSVFTVYIK